MNMGFLKNCIAAIFILALQACTSKVKPAAKEEQPVTTATPTAMKEPVTKTLPSFAVLDASGNKLDLQQFKGKKIFVNLWATWCPPCRAEMPSIDKLYQAADKEKTQFVLLALDRDF